jgi:uncharacterized membrane protein YhaH (DUF805 family)
VFLSLRGTAKPLRLHMNYLRGFFSFYGRMNRLQYATVMLIGYIGSLAIFALTWPSLRAMGDLGAFTGLASLIVAIWVLFAAMAKRFHDINKSGLYSLVTCFPVAGFFTPLVLLFYPGDAMDNRFGPPPHWF